MDTFFISLPNRYPLKQGERGKTENLILLCTVTGKLPTKLGLAGTCERYSNVNHEINRQAPGHTSRNVMRTRENSPVRKRSFCQSTVTPMNPTLPRTIRTLWLPGKVTVTFTSDSWSHYSQDISASDTGPLSECVGNIQ